MMQKATSTWREVVALGQHLGAFRWTPLVLVVLGLAAAFAEMLGVTVAVMFLFALLGQNESLRGSDGLVAQAFGAVERVVGTEVTTMPGVLVAVIALNSLLLYLYRGITANLLNRIAERMRDAVHHRYVTAGFRHLQSREQGELLHTLATETWTASEAVDSVSRIAINLCTAIVFGAGIFLLSWQIGLTAVAAGAILLALTRLLSAPARRVGEQTLAANQVLAERMLVSLHGMRTIRVFAQEPYVLRLFSAASAKVRRLAIRSEWLTALVRPIMEIGAVCALLAVVAVALAVQVDMPTTIAAGLLLFRLLPRLREMQNHSVTLSVLTASMRNVREALEGPAAAPPPDGDRAFDGLQGAIRFEGVAFAHHGRATPALDGVDFEIRRGEIVALAGPSGSGKTTIVNLLLRLYEPDAGRILVDGAPLATLTRESWLSRVALAGQDVELIEGTIAQNLRLAGHDASFAEMRAACAAVEILEDVEALPGGFDARIGPAGTSLSGGQRQRIGLARALIRRPEILILDEALSAVEPALEDRIRARLVREMAGRTIVSVSHRRDGTDWADSVIHLERGRIAGIERGRAHRPPPAEPAPPRRRAAAVPGA
jgi:ATP-binding cassette, subfamily B, bacterial MsbA